MTQAYREGQIILPQETNQGADLNRLMRDLQAELIDTFDGCTIVAGLGGWKQPNGQHQTEPVYLFTVAYQPDPIRDALLLHIANSYGARAGQHSVYVRKPDGTVAFIEPGTAPAVERPAPQQWSGHVI